MSHDVFISYSSHDKTVADATCATLEAQKVRCWIAPRDMMVGIYAESLVNAISECRVLVLILSSHANDSKHVRREAGLAVSKGKIIIPFRIENILPSKTLEYYVSSCHWLDAISPPVQAHIDHLTKTIKLVLARLTSEPESSSLAPTRTGAPPRTTERMIAALDPKEIAFHEVELRLSDTWDALLTWLQSELGRAQIESITEDKDAEKPSFYCSGKPGHLSYPLIVSVKGGAFTFKRKIDVIHEWLHPLAMGLESTKRYVAWDTSLAPIVNVNKESAEIAHPLAVNCRDALYWVLFAKPR